MALQGMMYMYKPDIEKLLKVRKYIYIVKLIDFPYRVCNNEVVAFCDK